VCVGTDKTILLYRRREPADEGSIELPKEGETSDLEMVDSLATKPYTPNPTLETRNHKPESLDVW
jgi:hypothetical protein